MLYYALRQTCHSIFPSRGTDGDVGAKGTQRYTNGEWEGGERSHLIFPMELEWRHHGIP